MQTMAETLAPVRPGDLITAELMNRIVTALNTLETRVTALEGAGAPGGTVTITGVSPTGPIPMGSELRVFGTNFGLPTFNIVTLDGVPVTQFKAGSSDTLLIFDVPAIQGVPPQGRTVTLTVSNQKGFASTPVIIVPAQTSIPSGQLFVVLSQPPPDPQLNPGNSYLFGFTVQAITNMAETYTLTPSVTQTGWQAVVVNVDGVPISPPQVQIPQGAPPQGVSVPVRVRLTIPAGTAGASAQLRLTVSSQRNPTGLTQSSGNIPITVGSPPPPPQDSIIVSFSNVLGGGQVVDNTVVVPTTGTMIAVNFTALLRDPGSYTVTPPTLLSNPGNLWTAQLMSSTNFTTQTANANVTITTGVSAQPGAAQTSLVLRVSRADNASIFGEFSQPIRT
jgi:hypothetical protein